MLQFLADEIKVVQKNCGPEPNVLVTEAMHLAAPGTRATSEQPEALPAPQPVVVAALTKSVGVCEYFPSVI